MRRAPASRGLLTLVCLSLVASLPACGGGETGGADDEIILRDQRSVAERRRVELTDEQLALLSFYDGMSCVELAEERSELRDAFYTATQQFIDENPDTQTVTQRLYMTETWTRRRTREDREPELSDGLLRELRAQLDAASTVERRKGCLTES